MYFKLYVMEAPKLFDEWVNQAYIPDGTRFPGLFVYKSFIRYCDGRFGKLPRKVFYNWLRSKFAGNIDEGKGNQGLWFLIGTKKEIAKNKISEYDFRINTCDEFVRWFMDYHPSIMYERVHADDLREDFFKTYAPEGYVFIKGTGLIITKQRFNTWMAVGSKFLPESRGLVTGRDGKGKWMILI